jgi:group I intron endonuclease
MVNTNNNGSFVPAIIYKNADTDKLRILTENKNRAGIYQWTHNESGKIYIGSAINLSKRLSFYYSISNLTKKSYIYNALLLHGYSSFSLTILEYVNITNLDNIETKKLLLEREQYYIDMLNPDYNILKLAGSSLGYKHSEEDLLKISLIRNSTIHTKETKDKISIAMTGENNPLYGKTHKLETREKLV